MRTLNLALSRDLSRLRGQVLATALVVACGVAIFVGMFGTWQALSGAQQRYYRDARFADVFVQLTRAPDAIASRLRALPGVAAVVSRVVEDVILDVPGLPEPAQGRLVGTRFEPAPALAVVVLREGRAPVPGAAREAVASEPFARANELHPGSRLHAVIAGRLADVDIVGVGISPEYIYEVSPGSLFPDNRRFGVLWMDADVVARAAGKEHAFNDVAFALAPGASLPAVIAAVDRELVPYGGRGAYGRDEQLSHRFITDEIAQNRVSATYIPAVFFAVAAFLLNVVLGRLAAMQRVQIGTLRAFGYGALDVAWHYVKFALVVVALGGAVGFAGGVWIGAALAGIYRDYYHFPALAFALDWRLVAALTITLAVVAAAGAAIAAIRIARLEPADAMRPAAPLVYRRHVLDAGLLGRQLPASARMVVRGVLRRPVRSALGVLGIAAGMGLVLLGFYFHDAMRQLLHVQFEVIQREDVSIAFREPRGPETGFELARLPGVLRVELMRAEPARIGFEHRHRRIEVMGLAPASELRRLVDTRERAVALPRDGIVLSSKLAELLAVKPGARVSLAFTEGERRSVSVEVAGLVDDYAGVAAYVDAEALARLAGDSPRATGALIRADPRHIDALYHALKRMPGVSGVSLREAGLASFRAILDRSFAVAATLNIVFACLISFGLVYNGARIALSERATELATLRVLGFTRGETIGLLLGEQGILTAAALPVGVAAGVGLALYFAWRLSTELYRMPVVFTPHTVLLALGVTLAAAVLSGMLVGWRVRTLDLLGVLKARE